MNRTVSGWTGFNIIVRIEVEVSKDNIGYLPTIDAPATNMSAVFEVLSQSEDQGQSEVEFYIVVVFDQAIYAKAIEVKRKRDERFRHCHKKRGVPYNMPVTGFRILCIESQVIAESSVSELWKD